LLRKALDLCPARQRSSFWRDYVRADAAWQPIRRSTAFAELAAEFPAEAR
jgi:hypothetical protein